MSLIDSLLHFKCEFRTRIIDHYFDHFVRSKWSIKQGLKLFGLSVLYVGALCFLLFGLSNSIDHFIKTDSFFRFIELLFCFLGLIIWGTMVPSFLIQWPRFFSQKKWHAALHHALIHKLTDTEFQNKLAAGYVKADDCWVDFLHPDELVGQAVLSPNTLELTAQDLEQLIQLVPESLHPLLKKHLTQKMSFDLLDLSSFIQIIVEDHEEHKKAEAIARAQEANSDKYNHLFKVQPASRPGVASLIATEQTTPTPQLTTTTVPDVILADKIKRIDQLMKEAMAIKVNSRSS